MRSLDDLYENLYIAELDYRRAKVHAEMQPLDARPGVVEGYLKRREDARRELTLKIAYESKTEMVRYGNG